jgi:hypothetical protein
MRLPLSCTLLVLAACGGGAQKPAATEADTSSLEPASGSAGDPPVAAAPSGPSTPSPLDATPAPSSSAAAAAAAPAAIHPVPGTTGSIDGKPFSPKLAQVAGPLQKDGRLLIVLHEGNDCQTSADAKPGAASMMLMVTWQDGYKIDLGSLKRAKKKDMGDAAFIRVGDGNTNQVSTTFKPTGLLTIVSAPMQQNATGKMKIDMVSGDYMLTGDLDVKVCFPPK